MRNKDLIEVDHRPLKAKTRVRSPYALPVGLAVCALAPWRVLKKEWPGMRDPIGPGALLIPAIG